MHNYKFIVTGNVQGVYYRKNICDNARQQNFSGYVKNLPDGSVEACATLEDDEFARFIAILEAGSPASRVDNIEQSLIDTAFSGVFEVR